MTRIRWTVWLPLALFAAFAVLVAVQLLNPASREVESAMIGKPLPAFALKAASQDRPGLSTADFSDGQPRLLNIFASWCVPCAVEAPQLAELERGGANIVAVAVRDRPEDVEAFLARYGNPFSRIGSDDLSEVQVGIGSSGMPETFVVDGKGIIRYQHIGEIRPEHVAPLLAKLEEARQ
ncbi:MAG: DsbE family thiol:disulfide interchange protein [Proteobacteria bacterium]|nr:MAG: DsbE family thiol:disulfide interchange protein [Pseudomonadota bacterium]